jgi:hypothetical protein
MIHMEFRVGDYSSDAPPVSRGAKGAKMRRCAGLALAAMVALAPFTSAAALAAGPPPRGGTIAIEPRTGDGDYDPSMPAFVNAVSEAFTDKGFTILEDPGHTAYELDLILSRADVGTGLGKAGGASVGIAGTGVVVPFSTGRSNVVTLVRTRLELRIRKHGEKDAVWDGTAVTVRETGTRKGADDTVALDLGKALLQAYPTQPSDVIGIP